MRGTGVDPPVPLTLTVTVLLAGSLFGMLKLSLVAPDDAGANSTDSVHDAAGTMVWFEHVSFFREKGAARESAEPIVPITRLALPSFLTVTVCEAVVPIVTVPNGICRSVVGETESITVMEGADAGGGVPPDTVKGTATNSSPCSGLFGSGRHFVPKNAPV